MLICVLVRSEWTEAWHQIEYASAGRRQRFPDLEFWQVDAGVRIPPSPP